ncbi:hypothetical protein AYO21_11363 [Fonsecaea monophora]|uniref:AAA+ ATPase domain-containing protein n=1 Tax=Fonsecaea monophora TaxID=254056 RepID=A0A177ERA5_9EURO|nr:hypothetical protein AYO21_11363 [Fonsecaea monophora]OAG34497.1 hypothetical protein AYO21_11363 [Fonsecaea monophora]
MAFANDYEISCDLYSETYDTILSGFIDAHSIGDPSGTWLNTTAFLLHSAKQEYLTFLDNLVLHLSRELGADLVTLDVQDLDDLCQHFCPEEHPEPEKHTDYPHQFIEWYFKDDEDRNRSSKPSMEDIVNAIISAAEMKTTRGHSQSSSKAPRLIVHLTNLEKLGQRLSQSPSFWRHLHEVIEQRRSENKATVVIATRVPAVPRHTIKELDFMDTVLDSLYLRGESTIPLVPKATEKARVASERDRNAHVWTSKSRELRRALRWTLRHKLDSDKLLPHAMWELPDSEDIKIDAQKWSNTTIGRLTRQICARISSLSGIEMDYVFEIIARHARNQTTLTKYASAWQNNKFEDISTANLDQSDDDRWSEGGEGSGDESEESTEEEHLTTGSESLWIDQELKESLHQLLSLRGSRRTYGLLAKASISGAIIYGPPGTGKTHFARTIAKESASNFIAVTPADLESSAIGETEKQIQAVFALARKLDPCVIFLDEGDSLLRRRQSNDRHWVRSQMAQFLTEIDGLQQRGGNPFLLVATNRPGDLDDAICRRLPHTVHVGLPDEEGRKAILDIYLKEEQVAEDVDVTTLAAIHTKGFSGADLRSLCIQAAMIAQAEVDKNQTPSTEEEVCEEPRKIILTEGHIHKALQRTRPSVTPKMLKALQKFRNRRGD